MKREKYLPEIFLTIFLLACFSMVFSQDTLTGCYSRQDGKIWLNDDSTFKFWYSFDTYRGWAIGNWTSSGRKITLKPIPVYDTIAIIDKNGNSKDSLILSQDYTPSRIINDPNTRSISVFQYEQNFKHCPASMLYKKNKLYILKNGKPQKKKIGNGYYIDPFVPWYTRE